MKSITKRQHYVWRNYLKPWLIKNRIACYRRSDGRNFVTKPENIASETFFYRIEKLSREDLQWISAIINLASDPAARKLHRGTVNIFQTVHRAREYLSDSWLHLHSPGEIEREFLGIEKTIGEHYHSSIENMSQSTLASLQNKDCSFYANRDEAFGFIHFVTQQFFRTPKLRELSVRRKISIPGLDLRRTWFIESQIYAANVAGGIAAERADFKFTFVTNKTDIGFITGDQPVISLGSDQDQDLKLYYPLGPKLAVIFKKDSPSPLRTVKDATVTDVEMYNKRIYKNSHDQIYGSTTEHLKEIATSYKQQISDE